jgi:hypothetical protein
MRLQASISYFYPALDRHRLKDFDTDDRLRVQVSWLTAQEHQFTDLDGLFKALVKL